MKISVSTYIAVYTCCKDDRPLFVCSRPIDFGKQRLEHRKACNLPVTDSDAIHWVTSPARIRDRQQGTQRRGPANTQPSTYALRGIGLQLPTSPPEHRSRVPFTPQNSTAPEGPNKTLCASPLHPRTTPLRRWSARPSVPVHASSSSVPPSVLHHSTLLHHSNAPAVTSPGPQHAKVINALVRLHPSTACTTSDPRVRHTARFPPTFRTLPSKVPPHRAAPPPLLFLLLVSPGLAASARL